MRLVSCSFSAQYGLSAGGLISLILIAPYVTRSRAHARHRGLIAWWEGDTKREKEDERLKIASGTVLSNDRVRSRLLGKHKFDAKELFPTESPPVV